VFPLPRCACSKRWDGGPSCRSVRCDRGNRFAVDLEHHISAYPCQAPGTVKPRESPRQSRGVAQLLELPRLVVHRIDNGIWVESSLKAADVSGLNDWPVAEVDSSQLECGE